MRQTDTTKTTWKQTEVNLRSIFGSQYYNSRHFKDFKKALLASNLISVAICLYCH